ncbi:MAG: glycosyltransferase family 2 protein [Negativicutes bacterium]
MEATRDLISVVIPTHNRAAMLEKAVLSAIKQEGVDFAIEICVVDDASTDNTQEVLSRLQAIEKRLIVIRNECPVGGAEARNIGIKYTCGQWVAFLDDDDEWLPNKLTKQLAFMRQNPEATGCSCGYCLIVNNKIRQEVFPPHNFAQYMLMRSNVLGGASAIFAKRSVLLEILGFDNRLKSGQDWDLWLRLSQKGRIVFPDEVLFKYYVHSAVRISSDWESQYAGYKMFFDKHKNLMDTEMKRLHLARLLFFRANLPGRKITSRYGDIAKAVLINTDFLLSLRFFLLTLINSWHYLRGYK